MEAQTTNERLVAKSFICYLAIKLLPMKFQITFIFIFLFSGIGFAQNKLEHELKQAFQLGQQALKSAEKTGEYLSFFEGADDNTEIKYHFLQAREEMDSLFIYTKQAAYKSSDAAYFAKTNPDGQLEQKANEAKKEFRTSLKTLDDVIKKIDEYIIHGSSNRETYINQRLQDFELCTNQLKQANQKLQQALMMLTANPAAPNLEN